MSERTGARLKAVFSDLDGTLVHFPAWFEQHGSRVVTRDDEAKRAVVQSPGGVRSAVRLLPASTMGNGCVSERSIEMVAELRARGILFFIVTAARKSTLLERLPFLPTCDAAVCETGSRIYHGDELDVAWADGLAPICGVLERDEAPEERPEPLWQLYRRLQKVPGLTVDGRSYYGCFRVNTKGDPAAEARLLEVAGSEEVRSSGIDFAMNLGQYDFFPSSSGKGNAVGYLQERYGLRSEECACLFDDDNDLPMARACNDEMCFLPGLTSESVRRAAAEHPEWHIAPSVGQGVVAIEECLQQLIDRTQRDRTSVFVADQP